MAAGSSLENFVDFWLATAGARVSDPNALVSMASQYRTHLFPLMLKGLSKDLMVQSGKKIEDYVQLTYTNRFRHFDITDTFEYSATDSLTQIEVPWRFSMVDNVIYEAEIDLQSGDRETVYKKVKRAKDSEMELSFFEGMERALWAEPNFETMEASTKSGTGQPLSIPCFVTRDGLAPTSTNGILVNDVETGSTATWTSLMGISPTTYTNFRNQFKTFTNTNHAARSAEGTGVLSAFDVMYRKVQFRSPSNGEEYVKNTSLQKMKILSNGPSYDELMSLAREKNNVLTPRGDFGWPQGMVTYRGIAFEYIAILDDLIYDTTAGTAEDGASKLGYTWLFLNFNHIRPIFNSKHFRRLRNKDGGAANPNAQVMLEDTWHNLWCSNRREQGVVFAA
jgi:hypothetical protein